MIKPWEHYLDNYKQPLEDILENGLFDHIDYIAPLINTIDKNPEIYNIPSILFDLALRATSRPVSDEARKFVLDQFEKNGTIDAANRGELREFLLSNAQKYNYKIDCLYRVTNADLERIKSAFRPTDVIYQSEINNTEFFRLGPVSLFIDEAPKRQEIFNHYKTVSVNYGKYTHQKSTNFWRDYINSRNAIEFCRSIYFYNKNSIPEPEIVKSIMTDFAKKMLPIENGTCWRPNGAYDAGCDFERDWWIAVESGNEELIAAYNECKKIYDSRYDVKVLSGLSHTKLDYFEKLYKKYDSEEAIKRIQKTPQLVAYLGTKFARNK